MAAEFSHEELREASHHIMYEFVMLSWTMQGLSSQLLSKPVQDALLESFVLHFRCLLSFFYQGISKRLLPDIAAKLPSRVRQPSFKKFDDDVSAADYFADQEIWFSSLEVIPEAVYLDFIRANKQVMHMSRERLYQHVGTEDSREKRWYIGASYQFLGMLFHKFISLCPEELIQRQSPLYALAYEFDFFDLASDPYTSGDYRTYLDPFVGCENDPYS